MVGGPVLLQGIGSLNGGMTNLLRAHGLLTMVKKRELLQQVFFELLQLIFYSTVKGPDPCIESWLPHGKGQTSPLVIYVLW